MFRNHRVFDADLHVIEPADLWSKRMDKRFKDYTPIGHDRFQQDTFMHLGGRDLPAFTADQVEGIRRVKTERAPRYAHAASRKFDARSQIDAMDEEGIDAAVLFPTRCLYAIAPHNYPKEVANAVSTAYNDWLAEFCSIDLKRVRGAAMVPPHDVEFAVEETHRCVKKLGFKAIFLRPNLVGPHYWHHEKFNPLWAACEELDIPVCFHEGGPGMMQGFVHQVGDDRFETIRMAHTISHPGEMMMATISMVMGGVCERYPKLRVAFLEANCGWAPWLLWRMDEHVEVAPSASNSELLPMVPSEYFKRQCYLSIECDELPGLDAVEKFEGHNILFSTDFPHTDSKFPRAVKSFVDGIKMSDTIREKILWTNPAALYRFDRW